MKISPTIRTTIPNKDGSFNIKLQFCHKGRNAFLSTNFYVDSLNEWDGKKVVNREDAIQMNLRIKEYCHFIRALANCLPPSSLADKTVTELKNMVLERANAVSYTGNPSQFTLICEQYMPQIRLALSELHTAIQTLDKACTEFMNAAKTL